MFSGSVGCGEQETKASEYEFTYNPILRIVSMVLYSNSGTSEACYIGSFYAVRLFLPTREVVGSVNVAIGAEERPKGWICDIGRNQ